MNRRVSAIIQARIGSTRLPGKVLKDLAGQPMLARVVERSLQARTVDDVIVATTTQSDDDIISDLCDNMNIPCFRGSEEDVLDRYYKAAKAFSTGIIMRITSDCPLVDPDIIDMVASEFLISSELDYVSNSLVRTFPRGLDVEAIGFDALEKAWYEDNNPSWREHVTPYIYRNPDIFRIKNVVNEVDYSYMRWTVDTAADLTFVLQIYNYFKNNSFSWKDVLELLEMHPEWLEYNVDIKQKEVP